MTDLIRICISSCLLGENVRYDGGNKLDTYLRDILGRSFELIPLCPEVGAGLPIPREPMRLIGGSGSERLLTVNTGLDVTDRINQWSEKWLAGLKTDIQGFVFKSRSPSCGVGDVPIFGPSDQISSKGKGIFSSSCIKMFPNAVIEDEWRLKDTRLLTKFIERIGCRR